MHDGTEGESKGEGRQAFKGDRDEQTTSNPHILPTQCIPGTLCPGRKVDEQDPAESCDEEERPAESCARLGLRAPRAQRRAGAALRDRIAAGADMR